jgi:hypothetical protein
MSGTFFEPTGEEHYETADKLSVVMEVDVRTGRRRLVLWSMGLMTAAGQESWCLNEILAKGEVVDERRWPATVSHEGRSFVQSDQDSAPIEIRALEFTGQQGET